MKRRVVVVGEGIVSSLGHSPQSAFARLRELRNCVEVSQDLATYKGLHTNLWAPCGYVRPERYTRKTVRTMSPVSEMSLFAAEAALQEAGLLDDVATLKGGRLGIAFGSCSGGVEANLDFASILVSREVKNVTSSTYLKMMPQTVAVNLSVHFGTTGRLLPTGTACTSGSLAIGEAYEAIASGKQDVMIAGGAEEFSVTQVAVFDTLFSTSCRNCDPKAAPRAFDIVRNLISLNSFPSFPGLSCAKKGSPFMYFLPRRISTKKSGDNTMSAASDSRKSNTLLKQQRYIIQNTL